MNLRGIAIWLAACVFVAYAPSLKAPFHFDDTHSVESNTAVHSMTMIPSYWTDPATSSLIKENRVYRPLVYTVYSVLWWVGGGSTVPFHVAKLLMHFLVALAMFLIWNRLLRVPGWFPSGKPHELKIPFTAYRIRLDETGAAALLATLFALHPAATECAIYISATTSLQCAAFYAWAFWYYLKWRDGGAKDRRTLGISLALYAASMASKEEGVTLPAVVLATELLVFGARGAGHAAGIANLRASLRPALRTTAPYAAAGVVLAAWILLMNPSADNRASREVVSSFEYFITQWRAWLWYMRLWFWPFGLNADDAATVFSKSLTDTLVIQSLIGNALLIGAAWSLRARMPQLLYGLAWFYITISPASSVVVLAEAMNEHRMYLAFVGFGGGATVALYSLLPRVIEPRRLGWAVAAVIAGFVAGVQNRNQVWASSENLWRDTLAKNPTSGRAMNNLALVHMSRAEYAPAIELLENCARHWPTYSYCHVNLGVSRMALGRIDEAERDLKRAIELSPGNVYAHFQLGKLYEDHRKDLGRALEHFEKADVATGGQYADAKLRIARVLKARDGASVAAGYLAAAVERMPRHTGLLFEWGNTELEAGRLEAGYSAYQRLLDVDGRHLQGWYNSGVALVRLGRLEEAERAFVRTLELDPASEAGKLNLEYTREQLRRRAPTGGK